MIAVVGLSILSAPAAHSGFVDFAKRGFKSCTDNCDVTVCNNKDGKRDWCVKNCSYMKGDNIKIDMTQVCKTYDLKSAYNPNKLLSEKEKRYIEDVRKHTGGRMIPSNPNSKTIDDQSADYFNAIQNTPLN